MRGRQGCAGEPADTRQVGLPALTDREDYRLTLDPGDPVGKPVELLDLTPRGQQGACE
ncbi:MAG: hypothetical protein OXH85_08735 [Truepera sp.]|nr:hypothetical protein [Truepera sp.]